MAVNFSGGEEPITPGAFGGLNRNEGTIPGVGIAMSLDIPTQGDLKPSSMPPPLPPGPHPSLFAVNHQQQQPYQQTPQQQHHQMTSLQPPNLQQLHPNHMPILPHPHLPRPLPHNMPSSMPMHAQMGTMNQMGQPMQQGIHFMGMNPLHSGSMSGNQMYSPGGAFNRPQGAQMSSMPGLGGPYQPGNPSGPGMGTVPPNFGMPSGIAPPLPPGPPPHGQTPL